MKKLISLLSIFVLVLVLPFSVFAKTEKDLAERVVVSAGETIEGDFLAVAEVVEIHGLIMGDLYAFGGDVFVDGEVKGDLIGAAGNANIEGEIGQNLRFAAGNINYTGTTEKNVTVAAGTFNMRGSSNGNVYAAAGTFNVSETANITGNLNYVSDPDELIAPTASIGGTITRHDTDTTMPDKNALEETARGFDAFSKIVSFIITLVFGMVLIRFMPKYVDRASELISTSFLKSFVIGIAGLVLLPLFIIVLFATIIGIPFSILIIALAVIYGFIARIYVMVALGKKLEETTNLKISGIYYHLFLGIIVYYLLSLLPVFGGLIKFFVLVAGFGAALRNERNTYFLAKGKKIL